MARRKRFILSIDGAGMRALVPLRILESVESRMGRKGVSAPMHRCLDLVCGTSLSSLVAAGLAAPKAGSGDGEAAYTIAELRQFFEIEARDIFRRSLGRRLSRLVANPTGLGDETYDERPLVDLLKDRFGWTSMASALTHLVLPAYDIARRKAVFLSNGRQRDGGRPEDYYLWQAVRAASAMPGYFEPAKIECLSRGEEDVLVDGSLFMSDPALAAYVEARKLGWAAEDITLISLGAGQARGRGFDYEKAARWGATGWMQPSKGAPVISSALDGQSQSAAYIAECMFTDLGESRYIRLNGEIPDSAEDYDNARPGNIMQLNGAADRIIRDNTVLLDELADQLATAAAS